MSESNLSEFEYKEGETNLSFRIQREVGIVGAPVVSQRPQVTVMEAKADAVPDACNLITSPMVGTFYSASSEDAKPFIEVGDAIKKGQVIGIVEAMKLMNEIESPYDGVVEEILVSNREMVGFEQMLVRVRPY